MKPCLTLLLLAALSGAAVAQEPANSVVEPRWLFTQIGPAPGYVRSEAGGINNSGQSARTDLTDQSVPLAHYWSPATGSLALPLAPGVSLTRGEDITQVTSLRSTAYIAGSGVNNFNERQPAVWPMFLNQPQLKPIQNWSGGAFFGTQYFNTVDGLGNPIDQARAVGRAQETLTSPFQPIWWREDQQVSSLLGVPSGFDRGEALDIDRNGLIVGWVGDSTGQRRACRWVPTGPTSYGNAELLSGMTTLNAYASAIEGGRVVGTRLDTGQSFTWATLAWFTHPQTTEGAASADPSHSFSNLSDLPTAYRLFDPLGQIVYNDLDALRALGMPFARYVHDVTQATGENRTHWWLTRRSASDDNLYAAVDERRLGLVPRAGVRNLGTVVAGTFANVKAYDNIAWSGNWLFPLPTPDTPHVEFEFTFHFEDAVGYQTPDNFDFQMAGRAPVPGVYTVQLGLQEGSTENWVYTEKFPLKQGWKSYRQTGGLFYNRPGNIVKARVRLFKEFSASSNWQFDLDQVILIRSTIPAGTGG